MKKEEVLIIIKLDDVKFILTDFYQLIIFYKRLI